MSSAKGQSLQRSIQREPVVRNHADLIWSVADLLRGDYKRSEYGRVILPLVVLRRLDGVLSPTKEKVLSRYEALAGRLKNVAPVLTGITGVQFYNTSALDLRRVLDDPPNTAEALRQYVAGFSGEVREVFEKFELDAQISKLDSANLLYLVLGKFVDIDLGPDSVSNTEMGYIYEELVRKFSELSNETAGEHFTPREVVELMVNLLFIELYVCGLRRSEAVGLDLKDFEPDSGRVLVRSAKGNKQRIVYATGGAAEAVRVWIGEYRREEPGPLLCAVLKNEKVILRRLSQQTVYDALKRRGKEISVSSSFSPHDFRRTFVGDIIEAKDLATAQALAGHASPETTARYDRRGERAKKEAAEELHVPYRAPRRKRSEISGQD